MRLPTCSKIRWLGESGAQAHAGPQGPQGPTLPWPFGKHVDGWEQKRGCAGRKMATNKKQIQKTGNTWHEHGRVWLRNSNMAKKQASKWCTQTHIWSFCCISAAETPSLGDLCKDGECCSAGPWFSLEKVAEIRMPKSQEGNWSLQNLLWKWAMFWFQAHRPIWFPFL